MCVSGLLVVGTNSIQKIFIQVCLSFPKTPIPSLPLTRVNLLKREAGHATSFELGHVASFETKSSLEEEAEHWLPSSRKLKELFVKKNTQFIKKL